MLKLCIVIKKIMRVMHGNPAELSLAVTPLLIESRGHLQHSVVTNPTVAMPTRKIVCTILTNAVFMGLSYTLSILVFLIAIIAGHLPVEGGSNEDNLAAGALITPMLFSLTMLALSPDFAVNIVVNRIYGQIKGLQDSGITSGYEIDVRRQKIAQMLRPGIELAAINSIVSIPVMVYAQLVLESIFQQNPVVSGLTQNFLRPYALAMPPLIARMCFEQILFSYEKQRYTMIAGLISFSIGTACAYVFCFLMGLGFSGFAYGFVIEAYLTALFFGLCLACDSSFKEVNFIQEFFTWSGKKEEWKRLQELGKEGWPITLTVLSQIVVPGLINYIAGWLATDTLATQSFCSWLIFSLNIPVLALGQAIGQMMSRAKGEIGKFLSLEIRGTGKDFINPSRIARLGLFGSFLLMGVVCAMAAIFPYAVIDFVSDIQNTNRDITSTAPTALVITALGVSFETLANGMAQTLRQLGESKFPTAVLTISLWSSFVIACVLAFGTSLGVYSFATAYLSGNLIATLSLANMWWRKTSPDSMAGIDNDSMPLFSMCNRSRRLSVQNDGALLADI